MIEQHHVLRFEQIPERLAPWISDPRWFVVRNVVQILGSIGGPGVVGLLRSASRHSDGARPVARRNARTSDVRRAVGDGPDPSLR